MQIQTNIAIINRPIITRIATAPKKFDFFQAVRLFELAHDNIETPDQLNLRFCAHPSLAHPTGAIEKLIISDNNQSTQKTSSKMIVNFMGLTGPNGSMPHHFLEWLIQQLHDKNSVIKDFFDLFNHRFILQYYKAWKKYQFHLNYKPIKRLGNASTQVKQIHYHQQQQPTTDHFSQMLASFIGHATPGLHHRHSFADESLFYYTGLISQQPHSSTMIEAILGDYFNLSTKVIPLQGQWLSISAIEQTRLASGDNKAYHSNRQYYNKLGVNTVIGTKVWSIQNRFRIQFSDLTYQQFSELLPDKNMLRCICEFARYLIEPTLEFDIQLILKSTEVPYCQLSKKQSMQLGWNTWLKRKPFQQDADQLILQNIKFIGSSRPVQDKKFMIYNS